MNVSGVIHRVLVRAATLIGLASTPLAIAQAPAMGTESFDATLVRVEAAQVELVRGKPEAFKTLWSHRADVTLVGGLGGAIERGWDRVSQRLDWVSSQYTQGRREHEEVSRLVGSDVALVVQRETIRFRAPGETNETVQQLRATMVFRMEAGAWKIVHRHADSQAMKHPTGARTGPDNK